MAASGGHWVKASGGARFVKAAERQRSTVKFYEQKVIQALKASLDEKATPYQRLMQNIAATRYGEAWRRERRHLEEMTLPRYKPAALKRAAAKAGVPLTLFKPYQYGKDIWYRYKVGHQTYETGSPRTFLEAIGAEPES